MTDPMDVERIVSILAGMLIARQRRKVIALGYLLLPTDISWRRADAIVKAGLGTIYPFHQRWQGRLDLGPVFRAHLVSADTPQLPPHSTKDDSHE